MRNTCTRGLFALLGGFMLVLAVVAVSREPAPSALALTNCSTSGGGLSGVEQQLVAAINQERAAQGLGALSISPGLTQAAGWMAEQLANGATFSHTDAYGRGPSQRAQDCGYPGQAAENLAWGYSSVSSVVSAWMSSPGHRANILNASYTVIGPGVAGTSWVTDFGFVNDGGATQPPPPTATVAPPTSTPTAAPPTATPTQPPSFAPPPPTATPSPTPTTAPPSGGVGATANIVTHRLFLGANLVTYQGEWRQAASVVAASGGSVSYIYGWDSANQRWLRFIAGAPGYVNTLGVMRTGEAYFVGSASPGAWSYSAAR